MNTLESTKTIVERHAAELLLDLKEAARLVCAYSRLCQDLADGTTAREMEAASSEKFSSHYRSQSEALARHIDRIGNLLRRCEPKS